MFAKRTISNRWYYMEEDIALALCVSVEKKQRQTVMYCRVSSQAQKADLMNQRAVLEVWCEQESIAVDEWLTEIGGGLNFTRKPFLKIFDGIVDDQIGCLIVAHQDRLVRFGFKLIEHLCKRKRCDLIVLKTEKLSSEEEITQDLLTIVHCFSSRLYGLRNDRKALEKALHEDKSAQDSPSSDV